MPVAPSTDNYMLGKGVLSFDRWDEDGLPTGLRSLGNAPNFVITPTVETLEHFSSMEALRKKDKSVVISAGLTVKFTLEEYNLDNLAMAMFGEVSGSSMTLLASREVLGHLRFIGDPTAGPKFTVNLWKVSLKPTSDVNFIGDTWGSIEFEGTVEDDSENHAETPFGTIEETVES